MTDQDTPPDAVPERELKDQRIPIMMTASELRAIDDWGFAHRIRSRAETIRLLARRGMLLEKCIHVMGATTLFLRGLTDKDETTSLKDVEQHTKMLFEQMVYVARVARESGFDDPMLSDFVDNIPDQHKAQN